MLVEHDDVNNFVYEYCSNITYNNNKWHCRCPLCGDSKKNTNKKRFHITYNNGTPIFNCFNCNEGGSFITLYMRLKGISYKDAIKELFKYNSEKIQRKLNRNQRIKEKQKKKVNNYNYILDKCIKDTQKGIIYNRYNKILQDFRTNRKISKDVKLYICFDGYFKDRIIIPIYDENNDIIFFQGRAIKPNQEPKYLMPNSEKSSIIYNKPNFDRNKSIIITEGLIDAFMIGNQGTTCLGASITDEFLDELYTLTDKEVIICFDNDDAGKKAQHKVLTTSKYRNKLKFFVYPKQFHTHKDLNEIIMTNSINNCYEFIIKNAFNAFKIQIMNKIK
jgi:DNA primase